MKLMLILFFCAYAVADNVFPDLEQITPKMRHGLQLTECGSAAITIVCREHHSIIELCKNKTGDWSDAGAFFDMGFYETLMREIPEYRFVDIIENLKIGRELSNIFDVIIAQFFNNYLEVAQMIYEEQNYVENVTRVWSEGIAMDDCLTDTKYHLQIIAVLQYVKVLDPESMEVSNPVKYCTTLQKFFSDPVKVDELAKGVQTFRSNIDFVKIFTYRIKNDIASIKNSEFLEYLEYNKGIFAVINTLFYDDIVKKLSRKEEKYKNFIAEMEKCL